MVSLCLGVAAFGLYFIYDVNSFAWQHKGLRSFFFLGTGLLAGATGLDLWTGWRRGAFSGQTGDYRRLLRFMRREYGVALSPDSTAERFCYESTLSDGRGGVLPGRLVVRPTRVFLRGAEKSFFEIDVVLERPNNR